MVAVGAGKGAKSAKRKPDEPAGNDGKKGKKQKLVKVHVHVHSILRHFFSSRNP
jgi:hypothetical protein